MLIVLSTDLEIAIDHRVLSEDDAVLFDETLLSSDTTSDGEL